MTKFSFCFCKLEQNKLQVLSKSCIIPWGIRGEVIHFFFLHISSSWVKIKLHDEDQLPRLLVTALKVSSVGLKLHHPGDLNLFLQIPSSWMEKVTYRAPGSPRSQK